MMTSQAVEEKVRAGSARRRAAKPHLIYVYAVGSGHFWRGAPGELTLVRADPFRRGLGGIRVVAQSVVRMDGARPRTWTLRPQEVNEEGWLTVRLPKQMPRGLYLWRIRVGRTVSNPALFFVA